MSISGFVNTVPTTNIFLLAVRPVLEENPRGLQVTFTSRGYQGSQPTGHACIRVGPLFQYSKNKFSTTDQFSTIEYSKIHQLSRNKFSKKTSV